MNKDLIRKHKYFLKNLRIIFLLLTIPIIKLDNINKKEKLLTYLGALKIYRLFSKKIQLIQIALC
jgi:hypothetical protein